MKSENRFLDPCSRPVLAASTLLTLDSPPERPGLPSLLSDRLGSSHSALRPHPHRASSFRLTERDCQIIHLVHRYQAVLADQVQVAFFSPGAASRCQLRLTLLVRHRYLDALARRHVNDPLVYVVSHRSVAGNRLIRQRWGETELRRRRSHLGSLEHLLAVNELQARVERACQDLGWTLHLWQQPHELTPILGPAKLIPDAYFQIQRVVDGRVRTAAFFLELERATKSSQVLRSKLSRYAELCFGGQYQRLFGTRSVRVLVVCAGDGGAADQRRVKVGLEDARRLQVAFARFQALDKLKNTSPTALLTGKLWRSLTEDTPVPLFVEPDNV